MSPHDPTVRTQELGERLRQFRAETCMSLRSVARRVDVSPGQLSRIETGRRHPAVETVAALLAVYGVTRHMRTTVLALAREVDKHGWWQRGRPDFPERQRTLISVESRSERIVNYEGMVVPGLLQTGEYTRALLTEPRLVPNAEIEDRMLARLQRHSLLLRRDAPMFVAIIDELVLRRVIGGRAVLRRQLEYLMEAAARPNIEIRVLSNVSGHAGVHGPFCLLSRPSGPNVVMLENLTCSLFLEAPDDVARYEFASEELLTRALDAPESTKLIAAMAMDLDAEAERTWSRAT